MSKYTIDIVQIDKDFLKGRLQLAILKDGDVIAVCGDNDANAKHIINALNSFEKIKP